MLKVEIGKKKTKSTRSRQLHKKNYEAQFPNNLILKDVIEKKN